MTKGPDLWWGGVVQREWSEEQTPKFKCLNVNILNAVTNEEIELKRNKEIFPKCRVVGGVAMI